MSSSCIHCEGWGCRRCRRDYGEQMDLRDLLVQALPQIGVVHEHVLRRELQSLLRRDIARALEVHRG